MDEQVAKVRRAHVTFLADDESVEEAVEEAVEETVEKAVEKAVEEAVADAELAEVKVTIAGEDVDRAKRWLQLTKDRAKLRRVSFYDTRELALSTGGVLLRSRRSDGKGKGQGKADGKPEEDSTVKVRGGALDGAEAFAKLDGFKREADLVAGRDPVTSVSLTEERELGDAQAVERGEHRPRRLFTKKQEQLAEALRPELAWTSLWDALVVLGPVSTWRWKVDLHDIGQVVTFERWELPDGEVMLEASIRTTAARAEAVVADLTRQLEAIGVRKAEGQETKTRWVLDWFVKRSPESLAQLARASYEERLASLLPETAPVETLETVGAALPARAALAAPPAPPTPAAVTAAEPVPLRADDVPALRKLLASNPDEMLAFFRKLRGRDLTVVEAAAWLGEVESTLREPDDLLVEESIFGHDPTPPPADFTFPGYTPGDPVIDTSLKKFQSPGDALGYLFNGGLRAALYAVGLLSVPPLRWHHDHPSDFAYPLDRDPGGDLKIALFADFACGYAHTVYLGRQFAQRKYAYAAHLGDVYYAGSQDEVARYLDAPLRDAVNGGMELFLLPGNHEMYSRGRPWIDYIDRKREAAPTRQRQQGTYFTLWRDGFLIIGIDTSWMGQGRHDNEVLQRWLESRLRDAKRQGRTTILLSPDEPYTYGETGLAKLLTRDLGGFAREGLIDLWFWGNTHYGALFDRSEQTPFIGSCIGHAGYPFERQVAGRPSPATVRFLETGSRFLREDVRPDRGDNGYCELTLRTDGSVVLTYIDWMGNERHRAVAARDADGIVRLQ